jgi:uncharacterized membrane protein YphA (DoxX/SURF4 family)
MLVRRIARPLLSFSIIGGGLNALRDTRSRAEHAEPLIQASTQHLPPGVATRLPRNPETLVRINAAVQIGAGVLLALGRAPRLSSAALSASVIPSSLNNHAFWEEQDPNLRAAKRGEFLKDLGLVGGLMIAAVDTEGKPSIGWRGRRAARRAYATVAGGNSTMGEELSQGAQRAVDRGRDLAETAGESGRKLARTARQEAPHLAEAAKERGAEWADVVRRTGSDVAEAAKEAVENRRAS